MLEVGSGPGLHSTMLASTFLKGGGLLVSCDANRSMISLMADRFCESAYCQGKGNKFFHEADVDFTEQSSITQDGVLQSLCDLDAVADS